MLNRRDSRARASSSVMLNRFESMEMDRSSPSSLFNNSEAPTAALLLSSLSSALFMTCSMRSRRTFASAEALSAASFSCVSASCIRFSASCSRFSASCSRFSASCLALFISFMSAMAFSSAACAFSFSARAIFSSASYSVWSFFSLASLSVWSFFSSKAFRNSSWKKVKWSMNWTYRIGDLPTSNP